MLTRPRRSTLFPYTTLFRSMLSWYPVPFATGYRIYRGTSPHGENVYYAPAGTKTTFTDTGAAATAGTPPATSTAIQTVTRSEEHTLNSSHMSISYAVFCLKK